MVCMYVCMDDLIVCSHFSLNIPPQGTSIYFSYGKWMSIIHSKPFVANLLWFSTHATAMSRNGEIDHHTVAGPHGIWSPEPQAWQRWRCEAAGEVGLVKRWSGNWDLDWHNLMFIWIFIIVFFFFVGGMMLRTHTHIYIYIHNYAWYLGVFEHGASSGELIKRLVLWPPWPMFKWLIFGELCFERQIIINHSCLWAIFHRCVKYPGGLYQYLWTIHDSAIFFIEIEKHEIKVAPVAATDHFHPRLPTWDMPWRTGALQLDERWCRRLGWCFPP